jgi:steroid delta-isomerase-like uncharacterized protein
MLTEQNDVRTAEANKALVRRYLEAVDTGDISILDEYIDPSYVDHNPQPVPGIAPGLAGLKQAFPVTKAAFLEPRHLIEDQVAAGDKVVTRIRASGIHVGPYIGVPPSGRRVETTAISIYRIANGKLVEHWAIPDGVGLLQNFGLMPRRPVFEACPGGSMSTENIELARRWFDEIVSGHALDRFDDLVTPDFVDRSPYLPPDSGSQQAKAFWEEFLRVFPDFSAQIDDIIPQDGKVVVRYTAQATHQGTFAGVPATGRPFVVGGIDILRCEDGRITERTGELDTLALLAQVGALQPPPSPS